MDRLCRKQETPTPFGLRFEADMGTITGVTSCSRKGDSVNEYRTGIAILFGLPKIMTQAILAHEMMHVWFRSKGIRFGQVEGKLEEGMCQVIEGKLEEGMCQVIGWKWLDWLDSEITPSSSAATSHEQAQFLRNLVETYKFVVENHGSDEYGQGFREVQWAVARFGLETTINHMITRGKLPEECQSHPS
ncbi:protein DA1-like [Rosa rugosa]|uniref:protein DA1-like n=1 Tax=Rosa rugosa TaxID=74645 RepID=UPI002B401C89|nr:protein DA1-like [Rosa rugosa]